jgi:hypothetical protein
MRVQPPVAAHWHSIARKAMIMFLASTESAPLPDAAIKATQAMGPGALGWSPALGSGMSSRGISTAARQNRLYTIYALDGLHQILVDSQPPYPSARALRSSLPGELPHRCCPTEK